MQKRNVFYVTVCILVLSYSQRTTQGQGSVSTDLFRLPSHLQDSGARTSQRSGFGSLSSYGSENWTGAAALGSPNFPDDQSAFGNSALSPSKLSPSNLPLNQNGFRVASRRFGDVSSQPWKPSPILSDSQTYGRLGESSQELLQQPPLEPFVHSNGPFETLPLTPDTFPMPTENAKQRRGGWLGDSIEITMEDQYNLYTRKNIISFGLAIGAVAPLANSAMDGNFRNFYQNEVRNRWTNDISEVTRSFGDAYYAVPFYLMLNLLERPEPGGEPTDLYTWSNRCLRCTVFGAPPLLITQAMLGATRPERGDSHWDFFAASNSASGHAFVGATPFLVAASMSERPMTRYTFIAMSTLPGLSRINDDAHYLSQVILGWWLSYLTVNAINTTDMQRSGFSVMPFMPSGEPGVTMQMRY